MTKYHVSTKTGKVGICHAVKRPCQYGENYSTEKEANKAVNIAVREQSKYDLNKLEVKPPILVEDSPLSDPRFSYYSYDGVEVSHDSYHDEADYYEDDEERASSIVYSGLKIESVDLPRVLASAYQCKVSEVPSYLIEMGEERGWDDPDDYQVESSPDVHGEEILVSLPENMEDTLVEEYWKLPNAVDANGILKYVRGKGHDTTGQSPVEAIRNQLNSENAGKKSSKVDRATNVSVAHMKLNTVTIPATHHYEKISGRPLKAPAAGTETFAGVVVKEGRRYFLMDGYHRTKFLKESTKETSGLYIILS